MSGQESLREEVTSQLKPDDEKSMLVRPRGGEQVYKELEKHVLRLEVRDHGSFKKQKIILCS